MQKFEDLNSIATYGFRGEALASISHIAHLSITTKTKESNCAWRAHYDSGKLAPAKPGQSADPKPVAGRPGTQITVEDLFYNVPTRRRAFRSASDEYNKILDMVGRYAVHCRHVAFSCKKHGESTTSIAIQSVAEVRDRIRQIYTANVANELIEYGTSDDRWGFKAAGFATNANYHMKKTTLLLFINNRSVESSSIRKAIEQTYSSFLPKNGHPFVYLSLEIDPQRVDVNVHPTKREVNFLNEDEIIQALCENIRTKLAAVDTSRTFTTQTLISGNSRTGIDLVGDDDTAPRKSGAEARRTPIRPHENNLVRTDTTLRKITSMFAPTGRTFGTPHSASEHATVSSKGENVKPPHQIEYEVTDRRPVHLNLKSVKDLRAEVRDDMHHELTEIFANHSFVGIIDDRRRLAAIQGGVKLFMIDYGRTCFEYFYQLGLTNFGNFGEIRFSPALDLRVLLRGAIDHEYDVANGVDGVTNGKEPATAELDDLVEAVAAQLIERREMLQEYFSLEITPAGELRSLPLLVKGYEPALVKLPLFLARLGPCVNWQEEKGCFETMLKEIAQFYVPEPLPPSPPERQNDHGEEGEEEEEDVDAVVSAEEGQARRQHVRWAVEHIFFPAFKAKLVATRTLMKGGVLEVANLKGLYRIFERC